MIRLLTYWGVKLPQTENDFSNVKVEDLIGKMRSFYERFEKVESADNEFAPMDFLELLTYYPVSMCSFHQTETLKLLIALFYYWDKQKESEEKENDYEGYSMDYLSLIFDRSKSSIHQAIKDKEAEAKTIIEEAKLRTKAKKIALEQLIEEEKQKLKQNRIEQTNTQISTVEV
jgi:hypothetical protein